MFSVLPLGTNGLYPTDASPTSGYLVSYNDVNVLLDVGSGVFLKLKKIIKPESLSAVIITHYHFDHVSDIGVLSYYLQTVNKKLIVYAPKDGSSYEELIKSSPYFDFRPIDSLTTYNVDGLKINFYEMCHPIVTYSVSITAGDKKLSYSSDSNLNGDFEGLLSGCDLAIMDSGFLKKDWNEHKPLISARHVGLLGKKFKVSRVLISHFNPTYNREDIIKEAKEEFSAVEPAEFKQYYL